MCHEPSTSSGLRLSKGSVASSVVHGVQVGGDPNKRCIPTDTDIVADLGGGLIEVAALRWKAQKSRIVREVWRGPGVRPTGQRTSWWGRQRRVEIVAELASSLVTAVVSAVTGDVALTKPVPPKQIVHSGGDRIRIARNT